MRKKLKVEFTPATSEQISLVMKTLSKRKTGKKLKLSAQELARRTQQLLKNRWTAGPKKFLKGTQTGQNA